MTNRNFAAMLLVCFQVNTKNVHNYKYVE